MQLKLAGLFAGLALLAAAGGTASAADFNNGAGSLKDSSVPAAIPVPAPMPIPVYRADWYFRADMGLGLADDPTAEEHGLGLPSAWMRTDGAQFRTFGAGVGYNFSDHWRADITGESRSQVHARLKGSTATETVNDNTTLNGGIVLFNAYYDFEKWGRFRPYAGAGLGFAINEFVRDSTVTVLAVTSVDPFKRTTGTLASAVMAGVSYDVSDITTIDLNYRFLWAEGDGVSILVNGAPSQVSFGDTFQHQLRAGVRFNVN